MSSQCDQQYLMEGHWRKSIAQCDQQYLMERHWQKSNAHEL